MKLSIIIPVYNVENYIFQCLHSIFIQIKQKDNIEVIIVNDGTPDNSMDIVREFLQYPQIIIIEQKNQGLSVARNTGLNHAQGDYIWFIDSDDWLLPNAINDVLTSIEDYPEISVFSTILENHIESKNIIEQEYNPPINNLSGKEYLQLRYKQGASQRFIFKKKFLIEHNLSFYPGILHEDGLFGYQMLYYADKIRILKKSVYAYRIRQGGSIMTSISMRTPNDLLFIHQQLIRFCETRVSKEDKIWYRLRIFSILIDLFQFSKGLAFDSNFRRFCKKNKSYISQEADFVIKNKHCISSSLYRDAFVLRYFPLSLIKLKYIVRKILRR